MSRIPQKKILFLRCWAFLVLSALACLGGCARPENTTTPADSSVPDQPPDTTPAVTKPVVENIDLESKPEKEKVERDGRVTEAEKETTTPLSTKNVKSPVSASGAPSWPGDTLAAVGIILATFLGVVLLSPAIRRWWRSKRGATGRTPSRGKRIALLSAAVALLALAATGWYFRGHIRFWWRFESLGSGEQGFEEYRHRQTGIVMVSLPGGAFLMGSPDDEPGSSPAEHPQHGVTLSPFMIAKFEVTQKQWQKFMDDNPSEFKGENLPVEQVSWDDCQEFCEKTGLSLPTEAQWEYACRAGTTTPNWSRDSGADLAKLRRGFLRPPRQPQPVGKGLANPFGLFDMEGNVSEWCEDVYDETFYKTPGALERDPLCDSGSDQRVVRGDCEGCHSPGGGRSAFRMKSVPGRRGGHLLGLRVSSPIFPPSF